VAAGHEVTATTRSQGKLAGLREAGAEPVLLDGLDAMAVGQAVARAAPEVIIHEMTAIPPDMDLRHFDRTFAATNRLRTTGLDHLLAAASAAGVTGSWPRASPAGRPSAPAGRSRPRMTRSTPARRPASARRSGPLNI